MIENINDAWADKVAKAFTTSTIYAGDDSTVVAMFDLVVSHLDGRAVSTILSSPPVCAVKSLEKEEGERE